MSRSVQWARRLTAVAVALVLAVPALAGTTGKLTGRVTDEKKQPLPGVNVRIEGQRLGGITDDQGEYFIIGIPAGRYSVRMNLIGYANYLAQNVEITPDFSTTVDAVLRTEAVQMNEVVVNSERPLLQKDATGTTRFISATEIEKLPTRGYRDAAAQQTGVVNFRRQIDNESQNGNTLIIRGGRPNETAYFVDGFSQQDPLTGTSSTSISNSAIEEVVVMTGGFNPEYGRIMSGAVNVVTREGAEKYFGAVEAVSDALAGSWVGANKTDYNVYDLSLGGPLWPGKQNMTFYTSGERRWQADRNPSSMRDNLRAFLSSIGQNPDIKPNNSTGGYTFQGKLGWQLNDKMSLKVGGLGSEDNWREYNHAYLLNLAHSPRYLDRNVSYTSTFNHTLSQKTFYTVGVNYFETLRKRGDGVEFDNLERYYIGRNPTFDPDIPLFFRKGHIFNNYLQRKSSYYGLQANMTSQVNRYHQLKFGGDFQRHTLRYLQDFRPTQLGGDSPNLLDFDAYGYTLRPHFNSSGIVDKVDLVELKDGDKDGPKHPKTWSTFVQDKFERGGVILNGGLRYDYINVDTPALRNDVAPLEGGPFRDSLDTQDLVANRTYTRISPRLGVSFPVDERTQLRFNYGQFYQQPNLQDLYVSYRFLQYKLQTGGYFVGFGNPNLKPERTIAYEVSFARQIGDRSRLDVTAYYKDVKDLVEITTIPAGSGVLSKSFTSFRNRDFATIKGVDVGYLLRKTNHLSGSLNYSFSFANGTGSVSGTQGNIAWTGSEPPRQTAPLDFDQRHKLSFNVDWSFEKGEGPTWNGWKPLENITVNALYNIGSGTPYTPTTVFNELTLANVSSQPSGPLNSRYGPWTQTLDLKASRGFNVMRTKFEAFLWVLNVMDTKNPVTVFSSSGSPDATGWLNTNDGQAYLDNAASKGKDGLGRYRLAEADPNLFANPRLVRFGLRTSF
jgi:outer membrane receptor protein involved in Fe transport